MQDHPRALGGEQQLLTQDEKQERFREPEEDVASGQSR